jgi:hypothetical protein
MGTLPSSRRDSSLDSVCLLRPSAIAFLPG